MKKKIMILALILVSGISVLRAQPVTELKAADMKSVKYEDISFSIVQNGNKLVVSTQAYQSYTEVRGKFECQVKFTGNARQGFDAFAGGAATNGLKLILVDETTGKSNELVSDENDVFSLVITFPESHVYKFLLNGKVIGTGYKPNGN